VDLGPRLKIWGKGRGPRLLLLKNLDELQLNMGEGTSDERYCTNKTEHAAKSKGTSFSQGDQPLHRKVFDH